MSEMPFSGTNPDCTHWRDHIALTPTGEIEVGDALGSMERVKVRWVCPDCLRVAFDEVWRKPE